MAYRTQPSAGQHLRDLSDHARALRNEAEAALQRGDYAQAENLIADAQMLAGDVKSLVDDLEEAHLRDWLNLLAREQAAARQALAEHPGHPARTAIVPGRWLKRVGAALGAGLALSLALTEY